jgi:hypothetical protein
VLSTRGGIGLGEFASSIPVFGNRIAAVVSTQEVRKWIGTSTKVNATSLAFQVNPLYGNYPVFRIPAAMPLIVKSVA